MSGRKGTNGSGKGHGNGLLPQSCPSGFSPAQLERLGKPLDKSHIHARDLGGRQLSYIEGWYAVAQANEIFGYGGWDRETVHFERVYDKARGDTAVCGYLARVRIRVRAGDTVVSREGSGWGWALERTIGAAHEKALKTAETDATKRALATFGSQFGLTLYDKEQNGATDKLRPKLTLFAPDGKSLSDNLSPEGYCSGMRQLVDACKAIEELDNLARYNGASLADLRSLAPSLRNTDGIHFADLLLSLLGRARRRLGGSAAAASNSSTYGANSVQNGADIREFPGPAEDFRKGFLRAPTVHSRNHKSGANGGAEDTIPSGAPNGDSSDPTENASAKRPGYRSFDMNIVKDDKKGGIAFVPVPAHEGRPNTPLSAEEGTQQPGHGNTAEPASLAPSKIAPGPRVDKSVLAIGAERRIRDKAYLQKIRELPCIICGRQPSHAHHLRFAQSRGLSQKVSDEYVVPLCNLHHGDLHQSSDEEAWWKKQKVSPLLIAAELWTRHLS